MMIECLRSPVQYSMIYRILAVPFNTGFAPIARVIAVAGLLALTACQDSQPTDTTTEAAVVQTDTNAESGTADISAIVERSVINSGISEDWPEARFATAGLIEATPQRQGDSVEGRRALLEEAYVSCGIPERVFRQLLPADEVVPVDGRTADADGLPYSMNVFTDKQGVRVVSSNCLTCHGTELFGELVIGLGNEFLDFTNDSSALAERAGALVRGAEEVNAWELYADRINAIAPYIRPHTVGVNPANNLTFALIAHRQAEDNAWSDEPLLPMPPTDVPPVSVPPWWRMAKKPAMFNLGEGRLDHARIMMAASMLCTDSMEELEAIDAYAPDIRAYIASLEPPAYPFTVDAALADEGREVFTQNCSQCHGRYGEQAEYPARLVPLEVVQTDPTLVNFAHGDGVPYIDWFNRSYYGQLSKAAPGPGYVAPPLDGVWATGPFLHNGSVPTIAMVLNSRERPQYWQHAVTDANDPDSYDQSRLGWEHTVLPNGKASTDNADDARIYDTDQPGYSNSGHLFGDHLTAAERSAVIEYLKTL